MFVEYQPLTPSSRAFRPGAMIVLISVCPVFMSLPASGDFVRRGQLQHRRNVGRQIRRGIREREPFADRRVRVDHARRNRIVALLERLLEGRHAGVHRGLLHVDLGAAAPDHHEPIAAVRLLERADVGDHLLGQVALVLALLDVRAVEPLHVALVEHRRHRLDRFELRRAPARAAPAPSTPAVRAAA